MITAGVDVGTRFLKIAVVEDKELIGAACRPMGGRFKPLYRETLREALNGIKPRQIEKIIATGYGGHLVKPAAFTLNDAVCLARGAYTLDREVRCVVDVGGLFIKVASLHERGFLEDSNINEKCAAGSGRFLEMVSQSLGVAFEDISEHCEAAENPFRISNSCAVFAESEVISQVNAGIRSQDLLAGVMNSIVNKSLTLLEGSEPQGRVVLSGGMAMVPAFVERLNCNYRVEPLPEPQLVAALGAAVIAGGSLYE